LKVHQYLVFPNTFFKRLKKTISTVDVRDIPVSTPVSITSVQNIFFKFEATCGVLENGREFNSEKNI